MTGHSDDTDQRLIDRMADLSAEAEPTRDLWADIEHNIESGHPDPRARSAVVSVRWLRAAALIGIFATGALSGSLATRAGLRSTTDPASMDAAFGLAAEVQRTGSEYVAALAAFTEVVDSLSIDVRGQGTDAGLAAFLSAADQLAVLRGGRLGAGPTLPVPEASTENRVRF